MNELERARARLDSGVLSNGASFAIWPDDRDAVTTAQVWVRAGSADDPPGASGTAHMLEHLMFRGTTAVPDGEFDARMEALGAFVNAATSFDYTFYTTTCPAGVLDEVLGLEADRFANLALTETAFLTEREVVANERRQVVESNPDDLLSEALYASAFASTPYAPPTIGTTEAIAGFTREGIADFYHRNYAPSNLFVSICGAVEPERTRLLLERTIGAMPSRGRHEEVEFPPASPHPEQRLKLPISGRRLLMAWPAPSRADSAYAAWLVFDELLGAAESSRLPVRLEVHDRTALDVHSGILALRQPSVLEVSMTLRRGAALPRVRAAISDELGTLAERGVDADTLEAAKTRLRTQAARQLAWTAARAELLGESWIHYGHPSASFDLPTQIESVTLPEVIAVGRAVASATPTVVLGEPR